MTLRFEHAVAQAVELLATNSPGANPHAQPNDPWIRTVRRSVGFIVARSSNSSRRRERRHPESTPHVRWRCNWPAGLGAPGDRSLDELRVGRVGKGLRVVADPDADSTAEIQGAAAEALDERRIAMA